MAREIFTYDARTRTMSPTDATTTRAALRDAMRAVRCAAHTGRNVSVVVRL